MIIIENSEETRVKIMAMFSLGEEAIPYDMTTVPSPEKIPGKTAELLYDKETNQLVYEYKDIPKTDIEILQAENEALQISQAEQDASIIMLLLGGN